MKKNAWIWSCAGLLALALVLRFGFSVRYPAYALGAVAAGDKAKGGEVYILCNKSVTVDEFLRMLAEAAGNIHQFIITEHG